LHLAPGSYAGIDLTAGDPREVWRAYDRGALLLSDSLAWRLNLRPGGHLSLLTASGPRVFAVAGIYHEYGSGLGSAMMSLDVYRRLWRDDAITAIGLYLERGVDTAREVPLLEAAAAGRQALLIRSNADIRAMSLEIFDRTFIITRILYWLAAAIAAVGLVSALLAWELDRIRELSILRALGLTDRGAGRRALPCVAHGQGSDRGADEGRMRVRAQALVAALLALSVVALPASGRAASAPVAR